MMRFRFAAVLAAALVAPLPGFAASAAETLDRWYAMLNAANDDGLAALLSDDARIRLDGLGIEQDKSEFLASMDEWRVAVAGAGIRHRIEREAGVEATVLVCYDFAENDILMRETFRFAGDLIIETTQTQLAQDCKAY